MLPNNEPIYQGKLDNFCAIYAVINGLKLITDINNMQARILLHEALYYESLNTTQWLHVLNHETDYQALVLRMLKKWEGVFHYTSFCPFESHHFPENVFQLASKNANRKEVELLVEVHKAQEKIEQEISNERTEKVTKEALEEQACTETLEKIKEHDKQKSSSCKNFIATIMSVFKGKELDIVAAFKTPEISMETLWTTLQKHVVEGKSTVVLRICRFLPGKVGPIVDHWTSIKKITDTEIYFYDCSLEKTGWYVASKKRIFVAPFGSIPPQTLALRDGYKLSLAQEEFAVICPENIHVISVEPSVFHSSK